MHLKNANGCSVCAWLLTSGGLRLTLRLTPQRHPRASRSGADQAHTLSQTNHPLDRPIPSHKRERATLPRRTTKSAAGSGAVPADPLGIGCRFSPPLTLSFCAFRFLTFPCFLRILLFRGGYYAGVGQTRRLPLLRNRKEQILEKIAAKTKRQYTDVLQ